MVAVLFFNIQYTSYVDLHIYQSGLYIITMKQTKLLLQVIFRNCFPFCMLMPFFKSDGMVTDEE
jgi:hypothetical protein